VSSNHARNAAESEVELLQVNVTELSDDVVTISVDQPHPPVHDEQYPPQLSCSEPHPSPSSCSESQLPPPSHDSVKAHPSTCSDESPPLIKEFANNQPLPLHESSTELHSHIINKLVKPHPLTDNSDPDDKNVTDNNKAQPLLIPSNKLLFELD